MIVQASLRRWWFRRGCVAPVPYPGFTLYGIQSKSQKSKSPIYIQPIPTLSCPKRACKICPKTPSQMLMPFQYQTQKSSWWCTQPDLNLVMTSISSEFQRPILIRHQDPKLLYDYVRFKLDADIRIFETRCSTGEYQRRNEIGDRSPKYWFLCSSFYHFISTQWTKGPQTVLFMLNSSIKIDLLLLSTV